MTATIFSSIFPYGATLSLSENAEKRLSRNVLTEKDWWPEGKGRSFRPAARETWDRARETWRVQRRPRWVGVSGTAYVGRSKGCTRGGAQTRLGTHANGPKKRAPFFSFCIS